MAAPNESMAARPQSNQASAPKPSATPNVPAGYDLSTNHASSSHVHNQPNGYQNPSAGNEEQFNPSRSITSFPNGTVVSARHAQTPTGHLAGISHVPAATSAVGSS
jgi:hypothetical protein